MLQWLQKLEAGRGVLQGLLQPCARVFLRSKESVILDTDSLSPI